MQSAYRMKERPAMVQASSTADDFMAGHAIPHFQNDLGVPSIGVGTKKFMCMGANPPFDHPHIFIDMGSEAEAVCSYCSTLYRFEPSLGAHEADPADCAVHDAV
jgi:uncharacterized Zn-finger protein